ncbi:unnamed protein product [Calicophoron daubneyi]|uniref:HIT-type domain-containing protein n=1 Tax=Calicophoron daubneyi TaxID=300641 RepID=A0AAV2T5V5_CALDB
MSDSDSTWPATDDFGSRFLEVDEYSSGPNDESVEETKPPSPIPPRIRTRKASGLTSLIRNSTRLNKGRRIQAYDSPEEGANEDGRTEEIAESTPRSSSRSRSRRIAASNRRDGNSDSEDPSEDQDDELFTFRHPKSLTARQMSLQMQREAAAAVPAKEDTAPSRVSTDFSLISLESLETPKSGTVPTPEQLEARQRRIAHRRESARNKVEMEKRLTVERLLKINANSVGVHKRGRGRGRGIRGQGISHSSSISSMLGKSQGDTSETGGTSNNDSGNETDNQESKSDIQELPDPTLPLRVSMAEQHGLSSSVLDPRPDCIRIISSTRLSPSTRICLPPNCPLVDCSLGPLDKLVRPSQMPPVPAVRLCAMGCGQPRRYACSKTGLSLCSLACYKANLSRTGTLEDNPTLVK